MPRVAIKWLYNAVIKQENVFRGRRLKFLWHYWQIVAYRDGVKMDGHFFIGQYRATRTQWDYTKDRVHNSDALDTERRIHREQNRRVEKAFEFSCRNIIAT